MQPKYRAWKEQFQWLVRKHLGASHKPTGQPVSVVIVAIYECPASWPKWRREAAIAGDIACTSVIDPDNICKAVLDAMNGIVFVDDRQVVQCQVVKSYGDHEHLMVNITQMDQLTTNCTQDDWRNHQSRHIDTEV